MIAVPNLPEILQRCIRQWKNIMFNRPKSTQDIKKRQWKSILFMVSVLNLPKIFFKKASGSGRI